MTTCWCCGQPIRIGVVVIPMSDGRSRTVTKLPHCPACDVIGWPDPEDTP